MNSFSDKKESHVEAAKGVQKIMCVQKSASEINEKKFIQIEMLATRS